MKYIKYFPIILLFLNSSCGSVTNIPPTIANNLGDGGLLSGDPCAPNCFYGIEIQKTTLDIAIELLQQYRLCLEFEIFDYQTEEGSKGVQCKDNILLVLTTENIVNGIGFIPGVEINIGSIVEKYGEPSGVFVGVGLHAEMHTMFIYFEKLGMMLRLADQEGKEYNLIYDAIIKNVSYYKVGTNKIILDKWRGFGRYLGTSV